MIPEVQAGEVWKDPSDPSADLLIVEKKCHSPCRLLAVFADGSRLIETEKTLYASLVDYGYVRAGKCLGFSVMERPQ